MDGITRRSAPRRGPSSIWRLTYRNPSWPDDQGPVAKLFDDFALLQRKIERLQSPRPSRPPSTILRIERIAVSGQWEEVDR